MNEGIIVFRHSFNEAVEYKSLITKVRAAEDVPVILVANKVFIKVTYCPVFCVGFNKTNPDPAIVYPDADPDLGNKTNADPDPNLDEPCLVALKI